MKTGIRASLLVLMACMSFTAGAFTLPCEKVFFSPGDTGHEHPLSKPSREFQKSYKQAQAGNSMEQRNVAVSYDAGYLVAACPEKARYWYQKAADGGDQIAQKWLERDDRLQEIADGPEFILVEKSSAERKGEVVAAAAPTAREGGSQQPARTRSSEEMLADITRPPDVSSSLGKFIQIGRLMGSMLGGR